MRQSNESRVERNWWIHRGPRDFIRRSFVVALIAVMSSLLTIVAPSATHSGAVTKSTATLEGYDAVTLGSPSASAPAAIGVTASLGGNGYYVLLANGAVDAYGATNHGSLATGTLSPGTTATGIALDAATGGYWVLSSDGSVKSFNAPSLGQTLVPPGGWGQHPAAVAIAAAPAGAGYYVLRANGAVYGYGVKTHGSLAGRLHYATTAPVLAVGIAVDPTTGGYWIATSTGRVVGFDAPNNGSPFASARGHYNGNAVTAITTSANGLGYYVLRASGEINTFNAPFHGSLASSKVMADGGFASALAVDPTTGGYYEVVDDTPYQGYENPLRAITSLLPQEVDQGVDYCGSGPIYAIGDGVVVNVYDTQWPSGVFISYRLTSGPAKGLYVYDAENVTPRVAAGERVTPTTVVGILHDAKTCLETGWADPPSSPERAIAHLEYNGKNSTAYGLNFNSLLVTLGARSGLPQPDGPPGPLRAHWPTW